MKKKLFFVILSVAILAILSFNLISLPDLSVEKITNIPQTLVLYDKDDAVFASVNTGENRKIIHDIPLCVVQALLCTEDVRFYQHNGIDFRRICGALWADIKAGGYAQGASTITQQLVKNSQLTNEKTILRKIQEAVLALQLEKRYEKDEILDMYLNFVYFGRGAYGIQAAAEAYFGKDAAELSIPQAAMLIGILKAPGRYAPHIDMTKAKARRDTVLDQMQKYGCLTQEEADAFKQEEIVIVPAQSTPDYGYYTDFAIEEAAGLLGISVSDLMGGGFSVYTALDSALQEELQTLARQDALFPASMGGQDVQTAVVALDNESGGVRALLGGRTHEGQRLFNRATALRQPGSCIKPILVYAPALEEKLITPATVLEDTRTTFDGYTPTNFHDVYYGKITARRALALSLNVPAVSLLQAVGIEKAKSVAEKAGIVFDADDRYLALALGGMKYGTSPLRLAGAYRALACGGKQKEAHSVRKICDRDGTVLYEAPEEETDVISASTAFLLTDMLLDAAKGTALKDLPFSVAAKTGTVGYGSEGYSDAWCTAYTQQATVCVWMGFDTTTPEHFLPSDATGGTYPARMASEILRFLTEKDGYVPFRVPSTVTECEIDRYALEAEGEICLASSLTSSAWRMREWFSRETVPRKVSAFWEKPLAPQAFSVQLNEVRAAEITLTPAQAYVDYCLYRLRGGEAELLARLSGRKNEKLVWADAEYRAGDAYYIVPEHKSVSESGVPLRGERTRAQTPA